MLILSDTKLLPPNIFTIATKGEFRRLISLCAIILASATLNPISY